MTKEQGRVSSDHFRGNELLERPRRWCNTSESGETRVANPKSSAKMSFDRDTV